MPPAAKPLRNKRSDGTSNTLSYAKHSSRHPATGPGATLPFAEEKHPPDRASPKPDPASGPELRGRAQPRAAFASRRTQGPRGSRRGDAQMRPRLSRLRRCADQQRALARDAGDRALRTPAVASPEMLARRKQVSRPVRRVRPAVQTMWSLLDPGFTN